MRIKKILAGIAVLYLAFAILLPVQVHAADQSKGTTITAIVPDTHTVTLEIGEHGSVVIDGTVYTGTQEIEVPRLAELVYCIKADNGWEIDTVSYGSPGHPETVSLDDENTYTAPALHEDGLILNAVFKKKAVLPSHTDQGNAGSETSAGSNISTGNHAAGNKAAGNKAAGNHAKTGDSADLMSWNLLLAVSALLVCADVMRRKRTERNF